MNKRIFLISVFLIQTGIYFTACSQEKVPDPVMQKIYKEIRTPYKYGLVLTAEDTAKMVDSPCIFHHKNKWYMTYIVFDGQGYETLMARSDDLLHWKTLGRIMSFSNGAWDSEQKAGYIALQDHTWGGSYEVQKYQGKYWMSYLGGNKTGYEAGKLAVGIASTNNLTRISEWDRLDHPVLSPSDPDARWYDRKTIYKSTVIWDKEESLGYPFIMFYNAAGSDEASGKKEAERISMAVSGNLLQWHRYGEQPVIDHQSGISGDAFITRIENLWVMFYFGAFWKPGAFDRFACSYDLVNWTTWTGEDLISPSEPYDDRYAHKPYVIKYNGIVYHFYCAVNKQGRRGIAVSTSVDLGKSNLNFPE